MSNANRIPRARSYRRPQLARFIICRPQQGCWIASEKHGQVTGLFPIDLAVARVTRQDVPREDKPPRRR